MLGSGPQDTNKTTKCEHPLDVLRFAINVSLSGHKCAIAMLTGTDGGAVRAPGAIMAICETGQTCGYLSGGCIDADIVLRAQAAMTDSTAQKLRYGRGSPFIDIKLPCGGGIDVAIFPSPSTREMTAATTAMLLRKQASFDISTITHHYNAIYQPKLRLRIAGRSADPIALARLSIAAGIETELWSADSECIAEASNIPSLNIIKLESPALLPSTNDDGQTAFVLMMHDADWEYPLLQHALSGPAFYIGAVGSPMTHQTRCASLRSHGVTQDALSRIHGPIGLVPSLRDASMLAISTLAEIIASRPSPDPMLTIRNRKHIHA